MRRAFADRRGFDLIAGEGQLSPARAGIRSDDPKWTEPFCGLSQSQFEKLVGLLRRRGGDVQWAPVALPLANQVLLIAMYWRKNLTLRQVAPPFGISEFAADRILDRLAPLMAISPTHRPRKDVAYIVAGALVPTRDRGISASSKNYWYSTNLQVVIDANSLLALAIGIPLPGSRNDCRAFTESGVDRACAELRSSADGGYGGTGALSPHRGRRGQQHLSAEQEAEDKVHRKARARVEHALSRLKNWKILRGCRPKATASTGPFSASPDFTTSPSRDNSRPICDSLRGSRSTSRSRSRADMRV